MSNSLAIQAIKTMLMISYIYKPRLLFHDPKLRDCWKPVWDIEPLHEEVPGTSALARNGLFRNFRAGTAGPKRTSGWVQGTCTLNCRNASAK
jgi:hypothetical protein